MRDRVREPSAAIVMSNPVGPLQQQETHDDEGITFEQLYIYFGHEIHSSPWHAIHALRSEYVTVLHLHISVSS